MAEAPAIEMSVNSAPPYQKQQHGAHSTGCCCSSHPIITATVEKVVNAGMLLVKKELGENATRPNEAEKRISTMK